LEDPRRFDIARYLFALSDCCLLWWDAPYVSGKENTIGAKPVYEADEDEGETYVFSVEAILHINDAGHLSSDIGAVVKVEGPPQTVRSKTKVNFKTIPFSAIFKPSYVQVSQNDHGGNQKTNRL
jgi:hypothetical protein